MPATLSLALAASVLLATPAVAHLQAADEPAPTSWSVRPVAEAASGAARAALEYQLAAGDTVSDAIVVENLAPEPLTLSVYGQDAMLTVDGKFAAQPAATQAEELGAWIAFEEAQITIDGGGDAEVWFTLTVPLHATPGDYAGAVLASAQWLDEDDPGVVLDARVGTRVHLRVPGEVAPALEISEVRVRPDAPWWSPGPRDVLVDFTVTNTGNVRLDTSAHGSLSMVLGPGRTAPAGPIPELLPGSAVRLTADPTDDHPDGLVFSSVLPLGYGRVAVEIAEASVPGAEGVSVDPVSATVAYWDVPWLWIAALVLIVVLVLRRRYRRARDAAPSAAAVIR